jgi:membrane-associated HD superfamily phosphohydrolase
VPSRKVLLEEDVLLLAAYQEEKKRNLYGEVPWILTAILLIVVFYNLLLSKILASLWQKKSPYHLLIASLIVTIFILKACLLLTPLPIIVVPFAFLPFLLILLQNERTSAVWTTLMGAMLVCLFSGRTLETLLFFICGGLTALLVTFKLRKYSSPFTGGRDYQCSNYHGFHNALGIRRWRFDGLAESRRKLSKGSF